MLVYQRVRIGNGWWLRMVKWMLIVDECWLCLENGYDIIGPKAIWMVMVLSCGGMGWWNEPLVIFHNFSFTRKRMVKHYIRFAWLVPLKRVFSRGLRYGASWLALSHWNNRPFTFLFKLQTTWAAYPGFFLIVPHLWKLFYSHDFSELKPARLPWSMM